MVPLTSQERKVIICILCLLIAGMGVDYVKKKTHREGVINYEALKGELFEKVDINRAGFSQLTTIPNVGEKLAWAIINYRKEHGDFEEIAELKNIKGIKEKKLEKLRPYIKTRDTP